MIGFSYKQGRKYCVNGFRPGGAAVRCQREVGSAFFLVSRVLAACLPGRRGGGENATQICTVCGSGRAGGPDSIFHTYFRAMLRGGGA